MNQLKQQQAFPSQISQDPWAPVSAVNNTNLQVSFVSNCSVFSLFQEKSCLTSAATLHAALQPKSKQ